MMDGSMIEGEICKATPVERSRLYDYMNDTSERFLKLRHDATEVLLINKSYVVYISSVEVRAHASHDVDGDAASHGRLELVA